MKQFIKPLGYAVLFALCYEGGQYLGAKLWAKAKDSAMADTLESIWERSNREQDRTRSDHGNDPQGNLSSAPDRGTVRGL